MQNRSFKVGIYFRKSEFHLNFRPRRLCVFFCHVGRSTWRVIIKHLTVGTFISLKPFRHICPYFFYSWYELSYLSENPPNSSPSGRPNVTEEAHNLSSETPISSETPLFENNSDFQTPILQNKFQFSKTNSDFQVKLRCPFKASGEFTYVRMLVESTRHWKSTFT